MNKSANLKVMHKLVYVVSCLLIVLTKLLFTVSSAIILGSLSQENYKNIITNLIISISLVVISTIVYVISRYLRVEYIKRFMISLRNTVLSKILDYSYTEFNNKSKDSYISNLVNDVNNINENYFSNLSKLISNIGIFVVCIVTITVLDYKFGIAIFIVTSILMIVNKVMEGKMVVIENSISEKNENLTVDVSNTFKGLELIKLNNIENQFMKKTMCSINCVEKMKVKKNMNNSIYEDLFSFVMGIFYIGVLYYLLKRLISGENFTKIALMILLTDQSLVISEIYTVYNKHKAYKSILHKITNTKNKDTEYKNLGVNDFSFNTNIVLENLSYKYGDKVVLDNVNLTLEKGKKYLVKGKSGVGKSTLIKILSKTYDDYKGEIYLDHVNLKDISLDSFNKNISYITQDTFLFEDTLSNNITLFKDYEEEEILEAVKLSGLYNLVNSIEDAHTFKIDENGKNMSGGERQRVSIARAIIRNSDIIFADECTSNLDGELGLSVEKTLLKLDSTIFEISHRSYDEVLNRYDYILEFRNGKIYKYKATDGFREVI